MRGGDRISWRPWTPPQTSAQFPYTQRLHIIQSTYSSHVHVHYTCNYTYHVTVDCEPLCVCTSCFCWCVGKVEALILSALTTKTQYVLQQHTHTHKSKRCIIILAHKFKILTKAQAINCNREAHTDRATATASVYTESASRPHSVSSRPRWRHWAPGRAAL